MRKSSDDARPVDPRTGEALAPKPQPGYYPDYRCMSQKAFWDEATRKLVISRIENVPPIRFFTPEESEVMAAVCGRILPQEDRDEQHKIPVLNAIDSRLFENRLDGYRYENMPPDQEAYRLGLKAIAEIAQHMHGKPFLDLGAREQESVLETLHDGNPPAAHDVWQRMEVERFWLLLVQDVVGAYYAHPYAWDEIGFGGPAYPRGYMRLEGGEPEPWESDEQRYEWAPPSTSRSAKFTKVGGKEEHRAIPGQGGTH